MTDITITDMATALADTLEIERPKLVRRSQIVVPTHILADHRSALAEEELRLSRLGAAYRYFIELAANLRRERRMAAV